MKPIFNFFSGILNCKISRIFFVANMIGCIVAFDWSKCFAYFEKINEIGCQPKPHGISFGLYDNYGRRSELNEILLVMTFYLILAAIFLIFLAPSTALCAIILGVMKSAFPALCDETFELIPIPIFMIVNGIYWILLGYFIESSYLKIIQNKPARKNPLSIFPK